MRQEDRCSDLIEDVEVYSEENMRSWEVLLGHNGTLATAINRRQKVAASLLPKDNNNKQLRCKKENKQEDGRMDCKREECQPRSQKRKVDKPCELGTVIRCGPLAP
jgi:hypothetical protein